NVMQVSTLSHAGSPLIQPKSFQPFHSSKVDTSDVSRSVAGNVLYLHGRQIGTWARNGHWIFFVAILGIVRSQEIRSGRYITQCPGLAHHIVPFIEPLHAHKLIVVDWNHPQVFYASCRGTAFRIAPPYAFILEPPLPLMYSVFERHRAVSIPQSARIFPWHQILDVVSAADVLAIGIVPINPQRMEVIDDFDGAVICIAVWI